MRHLAALLATHPRIYRLVTATWYVPAGISVDEIRAVEQVLMTCPRLAG